MCVFDSSLLFLYIHHVLRGKVAGIVEQDWIVNIFLRLQLYSQYHYLTPDNFYTPLWISRSYGLLLKNDLLLFFIKNPQFTLLIQIRMLSQCHLIFLLLTIPSPMTHRNTILAGPQFYISPVNSLNTKFLGGYKIIINISWRLNVLNKIIFQDVFK